MKKVYFIFLLVFAFLFIGSSVLIINIVPRSEDEYNYTRYSDNELIFNAELLYDYSQERAGDISELPRAEFFAQKYKENLINFYTDNPADSLFLLFFKKTDNIIRNIRDLKSSYMTKAGSKFRFYSNIFDKFNDFESSVEDIDESAIKASIKILYESTLFYSYPVKVSETELQALLIFDGFDSDKYSKTIIPYIEKNTNLKPYDDYYYNTDPLKKSIVEKDTTKVIEILNDFCKEKNIKHLAVIEFKKSGPIGSLHVVNTKLSLFDSGNSSYTLIHRDEGHKYDRYYARSLLYISSFVLYFSLFMIICIFIFFINKYLQQQFISLFFAPLSMLLSIITNYILLLIFSAYYSPEPYTNSATAEYNLWKIIYTSAVFIIPLVSNILIFQRINKYASNLISVEFEKAYLWIFIISGSFTGFLFIFSFQYLLYKGFDYYYCFYPLSIIMVFPLIYCTGKLLERLLELPVKIPYGIKAIFLIEFFILFAGLFLLYYYLPSLYTSYDFIYAYTFLIALPCVLFLLTKKYISPVNILIKNQENNLYPLSDSDNKFIKPERYSEMTDTFKKYRAIYLEAHSKYGKTTISNKIIKEISKNKNEIVFYSCFKPVTYKNESLDYQEISEAFQSVIPKRRFVKSSEFARKTGNIIGKLVNLFFSYGEYLIDEKKSEPENPEKIASVILSNLSSLNKEGEIVVVFDNIHNSDELSLRLVKYLIPLLIENNYYVILTASRYFNEKNPLLENIKEILCEKYRYELSVSEILFNIRYNNLQVKYTFGNLHGIIDNKYSLVKQFEKKEITDCPGILSEVIKSINKNEYISNFNNYTDYIIDDVFVKNLSTFQNVLKILPQEIYKLLECAAYCTGRNLEFNAEAIEYILKEDRLNILKLLDEAEKMNLIEDILNKYDFYKFDDYRIKLVLMNNENSSGEFVSQIASEYYKRYIEYCLTKYNFENIKLIQGDFILNLALKSYAIRTVNMLNALKLNIIASHVLKSNVYSQLEEAEICTLNALDIINNITGNRTEDIKNLNLALLEIYIDMGEFQKAENIICYIENNFTDIIKKPVFLLKKALWYYRTADFCKCRELSSQIVKTRESRLIEKQRAEFYSVISLKRETKEDILTVRDKLRDIYDNIKNDYTEESADLQAELLNYLGGSVCGDTLYAKYGLKEYYDEALYYLTLRLDLEIERINKYTGDKENYKDILQTNDNSVPDKLEFILNQKNKYNKKGLCFTLNYITRLVRQNEDYIMKEKIAKYALDLNSSVGDKKGIAISASILGQFQIEMKDFEDAFGSFEISFFNSMKIGGEPGNYSIGVSVCGMLASLTGLDFQKNKSETFELYINNIERTSIIKGFSDFRDNFFTEKESWNKYLTSELYHKYKWLN